MSEPRLIETVRARWCEVLDIEQAAERDDFFRVGGHSLIAVRLVAALEEDLGRSIPIAAIFELRTLGAFTAHLAELLGEDGETAPAADEGLKDSVRQVWETILAKRVSDDADFFALGGNSLAAMSICGKLEESFRVQPKIRMVFDHPQFGDYVAEFSKLVEEVR